jgi:hypothetical protein
MLDFKTTFAIGFVEICYPEFESGMRKDFSRIFYNVDFYPEHTSEV